MKKLRVIRFCGKKYCFPDFYFFKDIIKKMNISNKDRTELLQAMHYIHKHIRDLHDEKEHWFNKFIEVKHNCTKYGNIDIRKYYEKNIKNKKPTWKYRFLKWLEDKLI